jgi:hypothetical protein
MCHCVPYLPHSFSQSTPLCCALCPQVGVSALRSTAETVGGASMWQSDAATTRGSMPGSTRGGSTWTPHLLRSQQELLGVSAGLAELEEAAR